jgi:hypothetical protein
MSQIILFYCQHFLFLVFKRKTNVKSYNHLFPATGVAGNRGADFVQHLAPSRRARRNKALDPTALAGWQQASLLPSTVLAGQRRDYVTGKYEILR